jgi:hypothetical protein
LQGFAFWHERLNRGDRVVGIGGSDNHDPDRPAGQAGAIGSPMTVAYLPELSVAGLLSGLRSGRVFIDIEGTPDRILDMTARTSAGEAVMGGTLAMGKGAAAHFLVALSGVAKGRLVVTLDGREALDLSARFAGRNSGSEPLTFTWRSDGGKHWLRTDVRAPDGRLLLVGNPIHLEPPGGLPAAPHASKSARGR